VSKVQFHRCVWLLWQNIGSPMLSRANIHIPQWAYLFRRL